MGYRWEIDEAEDGAAGDAPAARRLRGAHSAAPGDQRAADHPIELGRMRDLRRLLLSIILVAGLSSAAYLGWRYWQGRQLRARITEDVAAALRLEERALAEGDRELYLSQQSPARLDRLRRAPGMADQRYTRRPPQPGLSIAASGEVQRIRPEPPEAAGGAIRSSSVELRYAVSDSLGSASFLERRHYRLDEAGRWIHDLPPEREREAEPIRWQGDYVDARYLPADADLLEPLLERAELLLADFCAAAAHCDRPRWSARSRRPDGAEAGEAMRVRPARLSFTGRDPGLGSPMRHEGLRYLRLPAPSLTARPADDAARDLFLRHILRVAILSYADAASGASYIDSYGRPEEGLSDHATLLGALVDAWIATRLDLAIPEPGPSIVAMPAGLEAAPLSGLWASGPGSWDDPRSTGISDPDSLRRLLADFAAHLAAEGDAEDLARSVSALPAATDPRRWIQIGFGDRGAELLDSWQAPFADFPADRALMASCWMDTGEQRLLYRPGVAAGLDLRSELCPDGYSGPASWQPGGGGLALLCLEGRSGGDSTTAGEHSPSSLMHLRWSGSNAAESRSLAIGDRVMPIAPEWTADGRWVAWPAGGPDPEARRLGLLPVDPSGASGDASIVWLEDLRPSPGHGLFQLRRLTEPEGSMHLALNTPLRAAPVGAALLVEVEDESVVHLDLSGPEPRQRWRAAGSAPVWSPEGERIALLQLEGDRPVLAVLHAATGRLLQREATELSSLLNDLAARAARDAPEAPSSTADLPNAPTYIEVRLRVGAWSPDGRWASLLASASLLSDWGPSYEASLWTLLDTRGSGSVGHRIDGFVPLGAEAELPFWVSDEEAWLLRNPRGSTRPPPVERLRLGSGRPAWDRFDPDDASARERLASLMGLASDPRFELRTEHALSPSMGPWTSLVERESGKTRWRLEVTSCANTSWEPIRSGSEEIDRG